MIKTYGFSLSNVSIFRTLTTLLLFAVLPFPAFCVELLLSKVDIYDAKPVLLVRSYHPGSPTFFEQIESVKTGLTQTGFKQAFLAYHIEFMDTKRFFSDEAVSLLFDHLARKLSGLPPYDVILTADDNTTKSSIKRQHQLFCN